MAQRKPSDPVVTEIEHALIPGHLVRCDAVHEFVCGLEKIEECDDSGANLSMFFDGLFCGWVKARQAAGRPAAETVRQILRWKEQDDCGFCHDIEKDVVKVLDLAGCRLLVGHFKAQLAKALPDSTGEPGKAIFEYGNEVRLPALSWKDIFGSVGDAKSYAALCERLGLSPRDCERLAEMEMAHRRWDRALVWVERGLALEPSRDWHNESSHSLAHLKPGILGKLGRNEDALALAWADFEKSPSEFTYEELMRFFSRRRSLAPDIHPPVVRTVEDPAQPLPHPSCRAPIGGLPT